jgi:diguanylate cyclase (GGDEF)-like protein
MVAQGSSLGILTIVDRVFCDESGSPITSRKTKLASVFAEQMSLAFANLQLRDTLKYQSVRDPLTGLFNRRHMEEVLERELLRAARKSTTATLLMIDIDHFKRFNDTYGHEAGDLLLRELGSVLRDQVRGGDVACRYGGEEFLLIMGETDIELACRRAENLREKTAALQLHYRGQVLRRITLSIGVAGFPAHGNTAAKLISAADEALYRAKREGRDRVLVAE